MSINDKIGRVLKTRPFIFLKLAILILIPIAIYSIPIDSINTGETICIHKNLFGFECWGCGITRAIISAVQLDFVAAWNFNPLFVIVLPIFIFVWLNLVIKNWKEL